MAGISRTPMKGTRPGWLVLYCVPLVTGLVMTVDGAPLFLLPAMILFPVLFFFFSRHNASASRYRVSVMLAAVLSLAAFLRAQSVLLSDRAAAAYLLQACPDGTHTVGGLVEKQDAPNGETLYLRADTIDGAPLAVPVLISGYNGTGEYLPCGAYVSFDTSFRDVGDASRDAGYRDYLKSAGVSAVFSGTAAFRLHPERDRIPPGARLRSVLRARLSALLAPCADPDGYSDGLALGEALLFGNKRALPDFLREAFVRCGVLHLLCVSGLHFSVIIGLFFLLVGLFTADRRIRLAVMVLVSFAYLAVCSFPLSAVRAAVMTVFALAGSERDRGGMRLLASVFLICLISPHAVTDSGFHLSVLATAGLLCMLPLTERVGKRIDSLPVLSYAVGAVILSLGASLAAGVYSLVSFGGVSLLSVPVTVFMTLPVECFLIAVSGSLVFQPCLPSVIATPFADAAQTLAGGLFSLPRLFSAFPDGYRTVSGGSGGVLVLTGLLLAVFAVFAISARRTARSGVGMSFFLTVCFSARVIAG